MYNIWTKKQLKFQYILCKILTIFRRKSYEISVLVGVSTSAITGEKRAKNLVNSNSFREQGVKEARHPSAETERPATVVRLEILFRPRFRHCQHPDPVGAEEAAFLKSWKLHSELQYFDGNWFKLRIIMGKICTKFGRKSAKI